MKKIIVTGHNGFIGTHLVRLLKEEGYFVVGIDTNYYDDSCKFSEYIKPDYEIVKDIRLIEPNDIKDAYAICHLAALSNDPIGELNEELTFEINYKSSVKIAELAKNNGVEKFIFSSSCSIYGKSDTSISQNENSNLDPLTAYAKSKVYVEKEISKFGDSNFCVVFLRNATAYGLSPKLRLDLVVNNLIGWAVITGKIKILSDGSPWRPLIHAEDIARAFIAAIKAPKEKINGHAFNVGNNNENYQIKDIAKLISQIIPNCKVEILGENESDSRSYRVDFTKIKNYLPEFTTKWNLENAIENIYKGYLDFGMDEKFFSGRYFIRLKQIKYLLENKLIDDQLFWR